MTAVFVNCAAVLIGSFIGMLFSKKVSSFFSVISTGAGIVTLILGIQMAFKYQNVVFLAVSVILGGILGTLWNIDGKILSFGAFLERRFCRVKNNEKTCSGGAEESSDAETQPPRLSFAYAFFNSSVLFCVGAMAIVGSFQAAVDHDYTVIFTKSVLDGFLSIVFGAAMGIGTAFSALSVFLYQGMLTLFAGLIAPFVTDELLAEISGVGGALIVMIGVNLTGLAKIKTADYLPSVLIVVLLVLAKPFVLSAFHALF
ncbi:MAG: DUF554 domain-containing protein [Bacteroides sp.]|nr:DUF554 domain-containing protein [Prevotella sp.]MCM1407776.1 DUF554 domain-containing protein [Treponema brennaborense]MCM1468876.1 DUF554 domain-containing protein [Bacteroides sp.]